MKTAEQLVPGLTSRMRDAIDTGSFTDDRWTRLICGEHTARALQRRGLAEDRDPSRGLISRWYLTFKGRQAYYLLHPKLIEAAHDQAWAINEAMKAEKMTEAVQTVTIVIEVRGANGDWQSMHPAETINDPDPIEDIAAAVAANQTIAEGDDWRVRVWLGDTTEGPHAAEAGPAANLLLF
jgi:hypothetical protein